MYTFVTRIPLCDDLNCNPNKLESKVQESQESITKLLYLKECRPQ